MIFGACECLFPSKWRILEFIEPEGPRGSLELGRDLFGGLGASGDLAAVVGMLRSHEPYALGADWLARLALRVWASLGGCSLQTL